MLRRVLRTLMGHRPGKVQCLRVQNECHARHTAHVHAIVKLVPHVCEHVCGHGCFYAILQFIHSSWRVTESPLRTHDKETLQTVSGDLVEMPQVSCCQSNVVAAHC